MAHALMNAVSQTHVAVLDAICIVVQEPLMSSAEAEARLTSAVLPPHVSTISGVEGTSHNSPAKVPLPEGFELSPFSPDVRWRKDRSARKLSSGATAIVYRYNTMAASARFVHILCSDYRSDFTRL